MLTPRWPSKLDYLKLLSRFDTKRTEQIASLSAMLGRSLVQHAPNPTDLGLLWTDSDGASLDQPPEFFQEVVGRLPLPSLRLRGPLTCSRETYALRARLAS
jgi:hypothetical protein